MTKRPGINAGLRLVEGGFTRLLCERTCYRTLAQGGIDDYRRCPAFLIFPNFASGKPEATASSPDLQLRACRGG